MDFLRDVRSRVIGQAEISTDGFHLLRRSDPQCLRPGRLSWRDRKDLLGNASGEGAQGRHSPAAAAVVSRDVVSGDPDQYVSASYVERQSLSLRMASRRFTLLINGFSKKLDNHVACGRAVRRALQSVPRP